MTPDEARKLMSGYATDSLTETERGALFSAALEDQELFDELAGEHSLKELINSPGVRNRLLAALTPAVKEQPRRVWWPWAAALACGIAAGTVWILMPRTVEAPVQVAQTSTAVVREAAPEVVLPSPPRKKVAKPRISAPPAVAPPPPANVPTAQAAEQVVELNADQSSAQTFAKGGRARATPSSAFLAAPAPAVPVQPLTYEFTTDRKLRIVPARAGVLQVTVGTQTIFARNPVVEGAPIELAVPDGALSVRIEFAAGNGTPFVVIPTVPQ